jgi:hydrogenase maturation protease
MTGRTLVAGVGNVFLRDDGFGVEVVRLLAEQPVPPGVEIRDFGIRGVHLVYDLLNGCDLFVLVDAAPHGQEPGTVSVLEVELPDPETPATLDRPLIDAHSLTPDAIFALLVSLGGRPGRSLVVACEPADIDAGMGLSDPVREALPHAVRTVQDILANRAGEREKRKNRDETAEELVPDLDDEGHGLTPEGGVRDAEQTDQGGSDSSGACAGD